VIFTVKICSFPLRSHVGPVFGLVQYLIYIYTVYIAYLLSAAYEKCISYWRWSAGGGGARGVVAKSSNYLLRFIFSIHFDDGWGYWFCNTCLSVCFIIYRKSLYVRQSKKKKSRYPLVQAFHVPRGISIERQTNFGEVAFKVTE